MKTINIQEKLTKFSEHWHPHQIAVVNDMQVLLAKVTGEFVWHVHDEEDELFQVIKGKLYIQFEDRTETLKEGEMLVGIRDEKKFDSVDALKNAMKQDEAFSKQYIKDNYA